MSSKQKPSVRPTKAQESWFSVDKQGLGRQAEEQGKGRLVGELIQNALDEAGVTKIDVTLAMVSAQELADLSVEDDSAEGFSDLSHSYTLYATSAKRTDPTKRGQFNLGEKLVLAVCEQASIVTTKGTVIFDPDQGRIEKPNNRERGSVFCGRMKMTQDEYVQVCDYLRSLLLPDGIAVTFNGQQLLPRTPIHTFTASLETQIADDKGVMRPTTRKAEIALYEALPGEVAHLYEMGLPIVQTGDKWHVSVAQKIPLNRDRNNVKPAYLRTIRTLVLNATHDRLTEADANSDWVRQASSSEDCSPEAIKRVLNLRFGDKFAAFDPNDKEAGKNFVAQGGQLVYGPMLSPQEWKNAKKARAIESAGKICPTPKPFSQDPDAKEVTVVPQEQWTPGMMNVARYSVFLGKELMDVTMSVSFVNTPRRFLAAYGRGGNLIFNLHHLGHQWFENGVNLEVDRLFLHEAAHEYSGDHLSEEYHDALCRLGAKLKSLALEKPGELRQFQK
jgi:hypothetical protein